MEKVYRTITVGEKTVLDGTGAELDLFISEPHPCLNCGRPVYAKRKYCNDSCKAEYHRKKKEREKEEKIKQEIKQFNLLLKIYPQIYETIKREALELIKKGVDRISVKYLVEIARIKKRIHIDNIFTPLFARKLANEYPEIGSRLVMRKSKYDKYLEDKK
ncbi:MAG: hypothetical protein ACTSYY_12860 [Promethearchaeota archaeon]